MVPRGKGLEYVPFSVATHGFDILNFGIAHFLFG
jgi:hypothetical protein